MTAELFVWKVNEEKIDNGKVIRSLEIDISIPDLPIMLNFNWHHVFSLKIAPITLKIDMVDATVTLLYVSET